MCLLKREAYGLCETGNQQENPVSMATLCLSERHEEESADVEITTFILYARMLLKTTNYTVF